MTGQMAAYVLGGLDSMILCVGLGPLRRPWPTWFALAAAFGVADGAAALLGSRLTATWPDAASASLVGPAALAAYGVLVVAATAKVRAIATSPVALAAMPIVFSLDNLAAAASTGEGGLGQAIAATAATASMAFAGCWLGSLLARRWPDSRRVLPGGAALAAAAIMSLS